MSTRPEEFERRILLCVTGLSPQVVTETFHALAVSRTTPFVPTEVHLVTTLEGADRARLKLLEPGSGHFWRLCDDHGIDPGTVTFDESTIHVIGGSEPLEDIRDGRENRVAADSIMDVVRQLTGDPDAAIHASIAGGRKTMGFFLGYALGLLGRQQDRLSHVLVSSPFESHPDFYYPPRSPVVLETRDGRPVRTDRARIELADIPFIRLRDEMPGHVLGTRLTFSETVRLGQSHLETPPLVFEVPTRTVRVGGHRVTLSNAPFAFYLWMALRRVDGEPPLPRNGIGPREARPFIDCYNAVSGDDPDDNRVLRAVAGGMDGDDFDGRRTRLHDRLKKDLGPAARPYLVEKRGNRPHTSYELGINPDLVRVDWDGTG